MTDSRIPGFYKLSVAERIDELQRRGWISDAAAINLQQGRYTLRSSVADSMVENVVGVFALPLAIAPNFLINGNDALVPLAVEEPSIVAALSHAASLARGNGGFSCRIDESLLIGQIHIVGCSNADAMEKLHAAKPELLAMANTVHPRLLKRGGGVRDIEFREFPLENGEVVLAAHLLVDTCDAMGANLVNTVCESIAPKLAEVSGGDIALRILSNLTDRAVVTASVTLRPEQLATEQLSGKDVRDKIVVANDIALADPYRAVTHNKGIMNGVDAVAIATGNDWRAIEAAAHAFAARGGQYRALTNWAVDNAGNLTGSLELPMKVATVGGTSMSNPAAQFGLAVTGANSAAELAQLMTAVGLAQNLAALRALVSSGIQRGHMRLHARSLAVAAGACSGDIDSVVSAMTESGQVKDWKAREVVNSLTTNASFDYSTASTAAAKVILLGEHAVVYGCRALAVPIRDAFHVRAMPSDKVTRLRVFDWGFDEHIDSSITHGAGGAVNTILRMLDVADQHFDIRARSSVPRGVGLGSSAALAVGIVRAIASSCQLDIADDRINEIAFECEKLAHGTPSGVDNTLSCYAVPMLFRNDNKLEIDEITTTEPLPLLLAFSEAVGHTVELVAGVRQRRQQDLVSFDVIFQQMDELAQRGATALRRGDMSQLGALMNINHGLLNAIGVSTPELEAMVTLARSAGAVGAKLTGAGGGGAIVALCPSGIGDVRDAFTQTGYKTLLLSELQEKVS